MAYRRKLSYNKINYRPIRHKTYGGFPSQDSVVAIQLCTWLTADYPLLLLFEAYHVMAGTLYLLSSYSRSPEH